MLLAPSKERIIRHAHLFCGLGAGARGFNMAKARVGSVNARFVCTGGIDVDAGAIRNFDTLTGVKGTVLDLFSHDQYIAFHGKEPPAEWREATPADVRKALTIGGGRPDVVFLSAPCKGFSGLLSSKQSATDKYQALNGLTLRGVWLVCEAFKGEPIPIILFENVPRIQTRGRPLLDQISAILRSYIYNVAETVHDCGVLGGLAQSRKRFLLIARQREIIPNFIYEPEKKRLRGVGEVIGKLPLPGDPVAGPMHRVPMLQWKTWMRLALVPAGRDWRALNDLTVVDGVLRDYGIVPDRQLRDGVLGVMGWDETAGTVVGNQRSPLHGRHSVADPRPGDWHNESLGVRSWGDAARVVAGASRPHNGAHSVADPRPGYGDATHRHVLGVNDWRDTAPTVSGNPKPTCGSFAVADPRPNPMMSVGLGVLPYDDNAGAVAGESLPTNGRFAVADPRPTQGNQTYHQYGVKEWTDPAGTVSGQAAPGGGPNSVADPRLHRKAYSNIYRVVSFDQAAASVTSSRDTAVADPRMADKDYTTTKYKVTPWSAQSRAVIGASTTGDGAFAVADPRGGSDPARLHGKHRVEQWDGEPSRAVIAGRENGASAVADPRPTHGPNAHQNKMKVVSYDDPSPVVTGSDRVGSGALSVADPRPAGLNGEHRDGYSTQGHYGVVGWEQRSYAVPAHAKCDRGHWSVADPREIEPVSETYKLPEPNDRLVARIIALDETWHRPFTTMDLAALQSIVDPEEAFYRDADGAWHARLPFNLDSKSDAEKREWIGNAVPSDSAAEIGGVIGEAILLAEMGETFSLSAATIWVSPARIALAVDTDQAAFRMEGSA